MDSTPGRGAKILHALWCGKKRQTNAPRTSEFANETGGGEAYLPTTDREEEGDLEDEPV